jgi:uncharacterized protein YdcH (DUF465 family)
MPLNGAAMAQSREERKVQSILKKADSLSDKIAKHESGEKKFNERTIASLAKQVLRLKDQITEFSGIEGHDDAVKQISDLSARLQGLEDQLAKALEATGGLSERDFDRQIKSAERLIQQAQQLVRDADKVNWAALTDARHAERMEKKLADLEEDAAEIVEQVPLNGEMMAEIEAARPVVADVRSRTEAALAAREGVRDRLTEAFKSGKATDDSLFIQELGNWSYEVERLKDQQTQQLIFWNGMTEAETYKAWAETLEANKTRFEQIQQDYAGMTRPLLNDVMDELDSLLTEDFRTTARFVGLDNLTEGRFETVDEAFTLMQDLRDQAVERTRVRIADAQAEMAKLESELNYRDLVDGNTVNDAMLYGDAILVVLDGFAGDASTIKATVQSDMDAARAELTATTERVYDAIVAANEVPSHQYDGSDADDLIARASAVFADTFKDEQQSIGAFIPDADWYRDVGEKVAASGQLEKFDESRLFVTVFVDEPKDYVSKWTIYVTKDHLKGDQITYSVAERVYDDPISPYRVYPKASITELR